MPLVSSLDSYLICNHTALLSWWYDRTTFADECERNELWMDGRSDWSPRSISRCFPGIPERKWIKYCNAIGSWSQFRWAVLLVECGRARVRVASQTCLPVFSFPLCKDKTSIRHGWMTLCSSSPTDWRHIGPGSRFSSLLTQLPSQFVATAFGCCTWRSSLLV